MTYNEDSAAYVLGDERLLICGWKGMRGWGRVEKGWRGWGIVCHSFLMLVVVSSFFFCMVSGVLI